METSKAQNRERWSGRYSFDGDMTRLCACGHTLGNHAAEAPHECFCPTFGKADPNYAECNCQKFRPQRKR